MQDVEVADKLIEINLEYATELKITGTGKAIKPFYNYDFYTFESKSVTGVGHNPVFNSSKQFVVKNTS